MKLFASQAVSALRRSGAAVVAAFLLVSISASAKQPDTDPLYAYRGSRGHFLYTTMAKLPAGLSEGPWVRQSTLCRVLREGESAVPVYMSTRGDDAGVRYAYSTDPSEFDGGGWHRGEIEFYVSPVQRKGMIPLVRVGTDRITLYASSEVQVPIGVWASQRVLGYVWPAMAVNLPEFSAPPLKQPERKKKLTPPDLPDSHIPPPSFVITDIEARPLKSFPNRTGYTMKVTNADSVPDKWFQSLKGVTKAHPCGDARLIAMWWVTRDGKKSKGGCKGLDSRADYETIDYVTIEALGDKDTIELVLEDRLTGLKHTSSPYAIGWAHLPQLLGTVGCKPSLGRVGIYLCSDPAGFAACEKLRKEGKPITCTRTGKK